MIFLAITFCIFGDAGAQIKFEPGYFIDKSGNKTTCLIRNRDWKLSPTAFSYKITEDAQVQKGDTSNILVFGIDGKLEFQKHTVDVDQSSEIADYYSKQRTPEFVTKTVYLKVIVNGKATLLKYEDDANLRFFMMMDNQQPEALIYKKYRIEPVGGTFPFDTKQEVATNVAFRQQIFNEFTCDAIKFEQAKVLQYNTTSLSKIFVKYNECQNVESTVYRNKSSNKNIFDVIVQVGFNRAQLEYTRATSTLYNANFDPQTNIWFGIEVEYILPFNNSKWRVIAGLQNNYYKDSKDVSPTDLFERIISVDYKLLDVPIGLRYYLFLNKELAIYGTFIPVRIGLDGKESIISSSVESVTKSTSSLWELGIGVTYKKFTSEIRTYSGRDILGTYPTSKADYKSTFITLGYRIL